MGAVFECTKMHIVQLASEFDDVSPEWVWNVWAQNNAAIANTQKNATVFFDCRELELWLKCGKEIFFDSSTLYIE